jgi:thiol-disulfide isomerase/thioredoxin
MDRILVRVIGLLIIAAACACAAAPSLEGMWNATISVGATVVPFRFAVEKRDGSLQASFFNGDDRLTSTSVNLREGRTVFSFPEYGAALEVATNAGRLEGIYSYSSGVFYRFTAERFRPASFNGTVPAIAGVWTVQVPGRKSEQAWHMIVRQSGVEASASILRVDGDSGAATGSYDGRRFVLGHFSGVRPLRLELTPQSDGSLAVEIDSYDMYVAVRADEARARGLPAPADPGQVERLRDPQAPFAFSFPDIDGRLVATTDARFRHKALVVSIGGSWCPGCHDEMPFLVQLFRKYRERGLEVLFLAFEEGQQLKSLERLRAFVARYRVDFPVLVAGDTRLVRAKLPQFVNLEAFPTTVFVGRDGIVRGVVAGFAGVAAGPFHAERTNAMTARVERLLAER